jgi:ketosteroid isomerase-like protein
MQSDSVSLAVVQKLYEAFGRGDLPTILSHLAEDVTWKYLGPAEIPFGGTRHGREQVAQFFAAIAGSLEVQDFGIDRFVVQDDTVVALGHERMRVRATGRTYKTDWAHVFTLQEGKVVEFREYADTAAVAEAFRGS